MCHKQIDNMIFQPDAPHVRTGTSETVSNLQQQPNHTEEVDVVA
jgi:hypothetical protein